MNKRRRKKGRRHSLKNKEHPRPSTAGYLFNQYLRNPVEESVLAALREAAFAFSGDEEGERLG